MSDTKQFEEVEVLKSARGAIAIITKNNRNGQYSVGFFKEFDRSGRTERTMYMQRAHLDALPELVTIARNRMDELADIDRATVRMTEAANRRA